MNIPISTDRSTAHWPLLSFICLSLMTAFAFAPALGSATAAPERKIVLIGVDALKNSVSQEVSAAIYERDLSVAISSVEASVAPTLAKHEPKPKPTWRLDSVGVGIGITGSVGLGPIINVSVSPQLKLVFSNHLNSVFPD